jgi:hypothetical protein
VSSIERIGRLSLGNVWLSGLTMESNVIVVRLYNEKEERWFQPHRLEILTGDWATQIRSGSHEVDSPAVSSLPGICSFSLVATRYAVKTSHFRVARVGLSYRGWISRGATRLI